MTLPSLRASAIYAGNALARRSRAGEFAAESARFLQHGEAVRAGFDYEAAVALADELGWELFSADDDDRRAFRYAIAEFARRAEPLWVDLLPLGRARFLSTLDVDAVQCFRIAGLEDTDDATVQWWYAQTTWARARLADLLQRLGRQAEERTIQRERGLLTGSGKQPSWIALEDSHAGYDVLSWRKNARSADWQPRYIEVKSSSSGEAIHLSRGEWEFARSKGDEWELQIWVGQAEEPLIFEVASVASHTPATVGLGRWESVVIPIHALGDSVELRTNDSIDCFSTGAVEEPS